MFTVATLPNHDIITLNGFVSTILVSIYVTGFVIRLHLILLIISVQTSNET